jgi:hypothetical protein
MSNTQCQIILMLAASLHNQLINHHKQHRAGGTSQANQVAAWDDKILGKKVKKKSEAIPATGCGDPSRCETQRLSHFVDNRLTDGGEVVISLTCRPPFTPRTIPATYFC